ncbi:putative proline--tRNA ligase [Colletotrichum fructicola]|uniref:proline--tRNA ligase n=5 Tax=Opisthokonta TaxID=33154 RepID=L2FKB5_COLFN|nr:putative proline--tRNA ligase [Colletotrichum fructicola]XP_045263166.1 putative proline--tRNA ligase C19C7.06 [Colletotrichum gloeosporioides]EQB48577.1 prolyl-tRNA synthetase [Colletotrichum gloeosporioides Cg-14]KAF4475081.1 putative proline--tRNA ligase [Colletotrichum fructicola Nara gc5]KAF4810083.1 putative proline--tRNA ligase [Colletotrichum siamense]KAF4925136.1 putative proline--tRNA ligase [Colletotrichum viniferum]KAI8180226.1 putative proline--tRNA ligase [Colletotrichum sp. 
MADAAAPEQSKSALKKAEKQAKMAAEKAAKAAKQAALPVVGGKKKTDDIIGITVKKNEDFSMWYQEVVLKAEMVEYYNEIAGFFILRPASMYIWGVIRKWFSERIEAMGVDETSFPIFLSSKSLEKEKDHVEGFAPELAWVTKAGDKDLEVPVAVRPTSEAVMYPYYSKWIRSHRDLPFRLNQWNSVVRWEAKQTTPFLRTREFLWQEGHTAHLTEELAGVEVREILELYAGVYEELLAVPVVRGTKTEKEKFAGGYYTTTVEGYIPSNGRGIQGATSHCLGQNFSKMFDITVENPEKKGEKIHVWQNSWGLSTRVIGVMVMIHGDDKGLVLPPRIAKTQVILIAVGITAKTTPEDREKLEGKTDDLRNELRKAGLRAESDLREGYTPAWKFNDWELRGVPLRLEFGPKDMANQVVSFARRDTGEKGTIPLAELSTKVPELLETIQSDMYQKAKKSFDEHRLVLNDWEKVIPALDTKNVVVIPHCLAEKCEDRIKELTNSEPPENATLPEGKKQPTMGMKSLCRPFDQPEGLVAGETKCLNPDCKDFAKEWVMFGRSY